MTEPKKANTQPASGNAPQQQNTTGSIVNKTTLATRRAPSNPRADDYPEELHAYLNSIKTPEQVKEQWAQLTAAKDEAMKAGDKLGANAAKDALAGLQGRANQLGMKTTDLPKAPLDPEQAMIIGIALDTGGEALGKVAAAKVMALVKRMQSLKAAKTPKEETPKTKPQEAAKKDTKKEGAKEEGKDAKGSQGAVSLTKKKRVKCFCVQDHAKGGRDEYKTQLEHQQNGINSMSAEDYLKERGAFTGKDPCSGKALQGGKTKKRNPQVTKDAKSDRMEQLKDKYTKEFFDKFDDLAEAERMGEAKAKRELRGGGFILDKNGEKIYVGGKHALHNQDMVAGGKDRIGTGSILGDNDFGWGDTNQHIGSQWNGERIKSIDDEACEMVKSGKGSEKMNIELHPCGKHEARSVGCKQKKRKSK